MISAASQIVFDTATSAQKGRATGSERRQATPARSAAAAIGTRYAVLPSTMRAWADEGPSASQLA
jgi:hypothetical protein